VWVSRCDASLSLPTAVTMMGCCGAGVQRLEFLHWLQGWKVGLCPGGAGLSQWVCCGFCRCWWPPEIVMMWSCGYSSGLATGQGSGGGRGNNGGGVGGTMVASGSGGWK
jgi:hypothetical protein